MQKYLDTLEEWLTDWRIAINVDKSQAIVFRKWGVIDPPTDLTLFENNIQWVPVVHYLGLHLDSRLTYKKHIDYLSDKFWGRIALAISLIGRSSPLSLENKVILYKQTLRPILTYGSSIWAAAAPTHIKRIQIIQNKILRIITNAPWYVRNDVMHHDLHMEPIDNYITRVSRNIFTTIQNHENPIIRAQTLFTSPHNKLNFAYKTTKWLLPLKTAVNTTVILNSNTSLHSNAFAFFSRNLGSIEKRIIVFASWFFSVQFVALGPHSFLRSFSHRFVTSLVVFVPLRSSFDFCPSGALL
ncbi:RNA-directed DNA polymerase from mobile element jockey [Trichonephila clavipes]|nr:RNA-directed DNA polymerase from mobile element jockey [Trichonephila clavipes]